MHIKTANTFLQNLKLARDSIQRMKTEALVHDSPTLAEMLEEVQVQIDIPMNWLRAAHHEGQKPR